MNKPHTILYMTSAQALIWDEKGQQIGELQIKFKPRSKNRKLLKETIEQCEVHKIGQWREWTQNISKEDLLTFLML